MAGDDEEREDVRRDKERSVDKVPNLLNIVPGRYRQKKLVTLG